MSWEWAEVVAWTRRHRNMASDFQRPSSTIALVLTLAQSKAMALPGRKDQAVTFLARMPVLASCTLATCWMALVTQVDLAGEGRLMDG